MVPDIVTLFFRPVAFVLLSIYRSVEGVGDIFSYSLTWLVGAGCRVQSSFCPSSSFLPAKLTVFRNPRILDCLTGWILPVMESLGSLGWESNRRRESRWFCSSDIELSVFGVLSTSGSSMSGDCWKTEMRFIHVLISEHTFYPRTLFIKFIKYCPDDIYWFLNYYARS